jgi:hypothetical protein
MSNDDVAVYIGKFDVHTAVLSEDEFTLSAGQIVLLSNSII